MSHTGALCKHKNTKCNIPLNTFSQLCSSMHMSYFLRSQETAVHIESSGLIFVSNNVKIQHWFLDCTLTYSLPFTKQIGKFACIVTYKITGVGAEERLGRQYDEEER